MASLILFLVTFTTILVCLLMNAANAQTFRSPCPQLFTYDTTTNETDRWYGTLTLLSDSDLLDIWLRLTFDRTSIQLGNWFGQVETSDSKEYHIRKSNFELKANVPQNFRFFLKYDPNLPAPKLLSFRLNGKLVCAGQTVLPNRVINPLDASNLDRGTIQTNTQDKFSTNFQNGVNTQLNTNSRDQLENRLNTNVQNFSPNIRDRVNSQSQDGLDFNSPDKVNSQRDRNSNNQDSIHFPINSQNATGILQNRVNTQQQHSVQGDTNTRDRITTQPDTNSRFGASTQTSVASPDTINVQTSTNSRDTINTRPSTSSEDRVTTQFISTSQNVLGTNDRDRVNQIDLNSQDRVGTPIDKNVPNTLDTQLSTSSRDRINAQLETNTRDRVNTPNEKNFPDRLNSQVDTNFRDRINTQLDTDTPDIINTQPSTNSRDRVNTQPSTNSRDRVNTQPSTNSRDRVNTQPSTNSRDRINTQPSTNSRDRVNTQPSTNSRDRVNTQPSTNSRDRINSQTNTDLQDMLNTQLSGTTSSQDSVNYNSQLSPVTTTRYNVPRDSICGTVLPRPRPLIAYAEQTHEGEFPWHSALYVAKRTRLTYICGASLISTSYIITTAHCVIRKKPQESLKPEELIVQLGKYNLKRFSVGYQDRQVSKILAHPQFESETFRNDIALLKLATPANVTEYVRPICLWQESADIGAVLNKIGKVVGWGYDETGKITEELMQAKMPVIPMDKCISSYPDFYTRFTSATTYCAGFANGTSPCNGDAGGGMVFPIPNTRWNNPVWQLRGLVSILPTFQNQMLCDVTHYTIFVDVAKFLDWIIESIN